MSHVARCTPLAQSSPKKEKWIQEQRRRRDGREAWGGKELEITIDGVLRTRGKMMNNKANGPSDCLVPTDLGKDSEGSVVLQQCGRFFVLVFLKKTDARLEKGMGERERVGSGHCVDVRTCKMVRGCGGRDAARRAGADCMEGVARWAWQEDRRDAGVPGVLQVPDYVS